MGRRLSALAADAHAPEERGLLRVGDVAEPVAVPRGLAADEVEELVHGDLAGAVAVRALEDLAHLRRVDAPARQGREVVADGRVLDGALLVDVDGLEEVREGLEVAVVEELAVVDGRDLDEVPPGLVLDGLRLLLLRVVVALLVVLVRARVAVLAGPPLVPDAVGVVAPDEGPAVAVVLDAALLLLVRVLLVRVLLGVFA